MVSKLLVGFFIACEIIYAFEVADDIGGALQDGFTSHRRSRRTVVVQLYLGWPNGTIPFQFDSSLTLSDKSAINAAIQYLHDKTCVWWKKHELEEDFVQFNHGFGCYAHIARTGGRQIISIGDRCNTLGVILHEMLHTLGFFHEHSRSDRNQYIDIIWENIRTGTEQNFLKLYDIQEETYGFPYDFNSVMHYKTKAWSKDGNSTIVPKNISITIPGTENKLSEFDILKLNKYYNCTNHLPEQYRTDHPTNGTTPKSTTSTTSAPLTPWSCKDEFPIFYCNLYRTGGLCSRSAFNKWCQKTCCKCEHYQPKDEKIDGRTDEFKCEYTVETTNSFS